MTKLKYSSHLEAIPKGLTRSNYEEFLGYFCQSCRSYYKDNFTITDYKHDYSSSKNFNDSHVIKKSVKNYPYSYDLTKLLSKNKNVSILEIGAGSGWLARYLKHLGYNDISFVEKDEYYLKILKQNFKQVFKEVPNRKFNHIIFVGLYEHLEDPVKWILNLYNNNIYNRGSIIFQLPNVSSLSCRINPKNWDMFFEPGHIELPSIRALKQVFSEYNPSISTSTIITRGRVPFLTKRIYSLESKWGKLISYSNFIKYINIILWKILDLFSFGETVTVRLEKTN